MHRDILAKQRKEGRLSDSGVFPKVVLIDTVSLCNLRCTMCVHKDMKRKQGIMPWKLFTKIIDEIVLVNKNTRVWMVFFGEALILSKTKPSIFDMIRYAKNKGLRDVVLNSNANLLDARAAKALINCGLDAIYVGIDAFSPETYSKIRVGGNYKKTVKNILTLIRLKSKTKSSKPKIYVQFVEMDKNKDEKKDFIKFWKKYDVTIKIRPMVSWAGAVNAPNLILDNDNRWPCHWAMQTMSVINTGKVVTCAVDLDAKFTAGDVNKNTLREIWNTKLKELRTLHVARKFNRLPANCKNCKDWQSARASYY